MAGEIERLISNLESMDGPGRDVDEARAEISALREELHTRGVTIDHLSAENARMREALEKIASETAATWVCDTARAALGGRDE